MDFAQIAPEAMEVIPPETSFNPQRDGMVIQAQADQLEPLLAPRV